MAAVELLRSVPALEAAAVEAVCCWRYEPATQGGKPVKVYFIVVIEFTR